MDALKTGVGKYNAIVTDTWTDKRKNAEEQKKDLLNLLYSIFFSLKNEYTEYTGIKRTFPHKSFVL